MSIDTIAPAVLPELDEQVGNELGNDMLLGTARLDTRKVGTTGRSAAFQQARAWTMGGRVD